MSEFVAMEPTYIGQRDEELICPGEKRRDRECCGSSGTPDADGTLVCSLDPTDAGIVVVLLAFSGCVEGGGGLGGIGSQFGHPSNVFFSPVN